MGSKAAIQIIKHASVGLSIVSPALRLPFALQLTVCRGSRVLLVDGFGRRMSLMCSGMTSRPTTSGKPRTRSWRAAARWPLRTS